LLNNTSPLPVADKLKDIKISTENGCKNGKDYCFYLCACIGPLLFLLEMAHSRRHCWIWTGDRDINIVVDSHIANKLKNIKNSNIKQL
jgi:hypothetical protein